MATSAQISQSEHELSVANISDQSASSDNSLLSDSSATLPNQPCKLEFGHPNPPSTQHLYTSIPCQPRPLIHQANGGLSMSYAPYPSAMFPFDPNTQNQAVQGYPTDIALWNQYNQQQQQFNQQMQYQPNHFPIIDENQSIRDQPQNWSSASSMMDFKLTNFSPSMNYSSQNNNLQNITSFTQNHFQATATSAKATIDDEEVFAKVGGKLSLLSSKAKYNVTIGEIKRRLSPPESLNASVLGGILRRAKSKNGGTSLREILDRVNISLPIGRRKTAPATLFTSLTEGEAVNLASDFGLLSAQHFPAKAIAQHVTMKHPTHSQTEKQRRRQTLMVTKATLNQLRDLLNDDRSPVLNSHNPEQILEFGVQGPLTSYSMITHGFGIVTLQHSLQAVNKYLEYMIEMCN